MNNLSGRSAKAREKYADSLMATSTAIFFGVVASVVLTPFSTLLSSLISGNWPDFMKATNGFGIGYFFALICLYAIAIWLGYRIRINAMDIYDQLADEAKRK